MVMMLFLMTALVGMLLGISHSGQRDGEQAGEKAQLKLHLIDDIGAMMRIGRGEQGQLSKQRSLCAAKTDSKRAKSLS